MNTPYKILRVMNFLRLTEDIDHVKPCVDGESYKEGHYYYCGYWGKYYKVLKVVDYANYQKVTVQW